MESVMAVLGWCMAHYAEVIAAVVAILSGVIGICLLIPGEQPEKALQSVVDVLAKISKK